MVDDYGVLLTSYKQFENVRLSTVMEALPAALQKEPVSMAELTGEMEYVLSFDRGEGNGGPVHPTHDTDQGAQRRGRDETPSCFV